MTARPTHTTLNSLENTSFNIETKAGTTYISGYISTVDKDVVDDIITKAGQEAIYNQVDEIKLDLEHESFTPEEGAYGRMGTRDGLIPIGKAVDKRIDDVGVWVKFKLNKNVARFKSIIESIKEGFLDAFSVTFMNPKPEDFIMKSGIRLLNNLTLLNVALTGTPINPNAKITSVVAKSRKTLFEAKAYDKDGLHVHTDTLPQGEHTHPEIEKEIMRLTEKVFELDIPTMKAKEEESNMSEEDKQEKKKPEEEKEPEKKAEESIEVVEPAPEIKAMLTRIEELEGKLAAPPKEEEKPVEAKADPTQELVRKALERLDKIDEKLASPARKAVNEGDPLPSEEDENLAQFVK